MAVSVRQASDSGAGVSTTFTGTSTTLTTSFAGASVPGNLVLLTVELDAGSGSTVGTVTPPAGFTIVSSRLDNADTDYTAVFSSTSAVTSGTVTFNVSAATGSYASAAMVEYAGVSATTPIGNFVGETLQITTVSELLTFLAITPTVTGGMVVFTCGANDLGASVDATPQTGWNNDIQSSDINNYSFVYFSHDLTPTVNGTAQQPTLNIAGAQYISPQYQGFTIFLEPAATAPAFEANYSGNTSELVGGLSA